MDWYRRYSGTYADPKFAAIARRVGLHRTMVLAVWDAVLECASASELRGTLCSFNGEDVAAALDMEAEQVERVVGAFRDRGLIVGDAVAAWPKRQFQSDDVAARVRKHRAAQRSRPVPPGGGNGAETLQHCDETPPDTDTDTDTESEGSDDPQSPLNRSNIRPFLRVVSAPEEPVPNDPEEEFERQFWPLAVRKVAKAEALREFRQARRSVRLADILPAWKAANEEWARWPRERRGYIPHPRRWLHGRRWEDVPDSGPEQISDEEMARRAEARLKSWYGGQA